MTNLDNCFVFFVYKESGTKIGRKIVKKNQLDSIAEADNLNGLRLNRGGVWTIYFHLLALWHVIIPVRDNVGEFSTIIPQVDLYGNGELICQSQKLGIHSLYDALCEMRQ